VKPTKGWAVVRNNGEILKVCIDELKSTLERAWKGFGYQVERVEIRALKPEQKGRRR
jgi:hypothetical protein